MSKNEFFTGCKTLQDVKTQYKKLVYQFHPDRETGNLETMKRINNEYEFIFEYVKNHPINEQEEKTSKFADVNDGYREQIEKIIFIPNIEIEIRGSWVWVGGDTKPTKNIFKEAGFSWSPNNLEWYWKPYKQKGYKHKPWGKEKQREVYGCQKIQNEERDKIAV
jgi:curved DNA-binding protein CbpA